MAEITFITPVETIKGKLQNRDKTIFRRKRILYRRLDCFIRAAIFRELQK